MVFVPRGPDRHQRPKLIHHEIGLYTVKNEEMLFSILWRLCGCKYSIMAKHYRVKPQTVAIWNKKGFPNPWWGVITRLIITRLLKHERSREGSKHKKLWNSAYSDLLHIPNLEKMDSTDLKQGVDIVNPTDFTAAATHVRTILYHEKRFELSWDFIKKPAYSGGFSEKVLRRALKDIGAVKRVKGFGEDKEVFWRLPLDEDYVR